MFERGRYVGMDLMAVRDAMRAEGFDPLLIEDDPGTHYPPHQHAETKLLAFVSGGMEVLVADQSYSCRTGDRLLIPGGVEHSALVHSDGCTYFWSEKRR